MKKFLHCALAVVCLLSAPATLLAQTSYGTVAGSVTDPTGAAVVGATVTITSTGTGETHTAKTNGAGGYIITSVGTGLYNVSAEATGFSKELVSAVSVTPSVTTSVNPVLKIGNINDTVEVSSEAAILQTESGEISQIITAKEVENLPISGLNAYTLVTTLPGVTTVTVGSGGNGPKFSANGSRPRANNYLIEGQDNNDSGLTGQGLQPAITDAIDNVSFLLNGNNAEFGYGGGGISNIVFKSGTNQYHGAVFERLFNSSLNATDHNTTLNGGKKSKTRENIYGFTMGGPVLHNRLFMFGAYQQDHFRASSQLSTLVVPTVNGYAVLNNYKSNPRVANLIKAYGGLQGATPASGLFPSSSKTVALGPDPVTGLDRGNVEYGGVQRTASNGNNASELDLKSDWMINPEKDKIQFRFIRSYSIFPYDVGNFSSQLPLFDTNQGGPALNAGIVETHIFSANLLNEFRASFGRINYVFDLRPDTYSNPLAIGPTVSITGVQGYGIPTNVPQGRGHDTYQLQDAISWTKGNHTMKFGFDLGQIRVRDEVPFVFYGTIAYVANAAAAATSTLPAVPAYTSLANYMDDYSGYTSSTGQSITQNFGSNVARPELTNQNYYVQDHWKASAHLAIDAGLRWEYYGAPFNYLANPSTDILNPFGSYSTRVAQQPVFNDFAPRFGFAYQPFDDKTVIRGAFGFFYDHEFTNFVDNIQASAPNAASPVLYGSKTLSQRGTPSWSSQFSQLSHTSLPTNTQTTLSNHLKNPLTFQYNLSIERQLPAGNSLTLSYVGSRSEHLYSLETLNPGIAANGGARVNTTRGLITYFGNSGDSDYNSLQADLGHNLRHGLVARVSYTFAKGLDDVSDPYSSGNLSAYPEIEDTLPSGGVGRGRDWGLSAYDHRQRAVLSMVYNSPVFHPDSMGIRILAHVVNNYTLSDITSFQTGSVYNVQTGIDVNFDGITNDRPVLTNPNAPLNTFALQSQVFYPTSPLAGPGVYCDGSYYNNASSKNPVTGVDDRTCHVVAYNQMHWYLGNYQSQNATISRNAGITPGVFGMDASAQREFKVGERMGLSFRAESFNVLNHANTGIPSFTLYGSTLLPIAPGYGRGTFANYASTGTGGRTLRFYVKYAF